MREEGGGGGRLSGRQDRVRLRDRSLPLRLAGHRKAGDRVVIVLSLNQALPSGVGGGGFNRGQVVGAGWAIRSKGMQDSQWGVTLT